MAVYQIGLLIELLKKKDGGHVLVASDMCGQIRRLHTYTNYAYLLSSTDVYEYWYEERPLGRGSAARFSILKKEPRCIGNINMKGNDLLRLLGKLQDWYKYHLRPLIHTRGSMENMIEAAREYMDHPDRYRTHDCTEVWNRVPWVRQDLETLYKDGKATAATPTYNPKYDTAEAASRWEAEADHQLMTEMDSVTRAYRTKAKHLSLQGKISDSTLTATVAAGPVAAPPPPADFFKPTGIYSYVDSVFAQVALKERHIVEFFIYFAIISYMKKSRRFPVAKVEDICAYLNSFLDAGRRSFATPAALAQLHRIGMVSVIQTPHGTTVEVLNQMQYVQRWESRWNSKQYAARVKAPYKQMFIPLGAAAQQLTGRSWMREVPADLRGRELTGDAHLALEGAIRPYFDLWFPMSAKMDTGFIHLLNGAKADMKGFLYELVVSSWNWPCCRTRIKTNLLVPASSQRNYERRSRSMRRRFNHLELPPDMIRKMEPSAQLILERMISEGGKFKRSKSGRIYRQEGNTYSSDLFRWKKTRKAARLRLSLRNIKLWKACAPVYEKGIFSDGTVAYSQPKFLPINEDIVKGQSCARSFVSKKSEMGRTRYFALKADGVAVVSTDPRNWIWFWPFMEYDRKNGDVTIRTSGLSRHPAAYRLGQGDLFESRSLGPPWVTERCRIDEKIRRWDHPRVSLGSAS